MTRSAATSLGAPLVRPASAGLIFIVLLVLLGATACRKSPAPARSGDTASGVLRLSQRNEPADLDPATAQLPDDFFVIRALNEGLLLPNPKGGEPLPGLAERYEVTPDGLEYTFHLRPDLHWSNGESLTAADVLASFQRALTPRTAAPKATLFDAVKNARAYATGVLADFGSVGFRAPDARTVVIALARPAAKFPSYVASGVWIPVNPRIVATHGRSWTEPAHHVGSGPFVLVEWRPQQRIVVRRNPQYHSAARVRLQEIQFLRFDSDDTEDRAYRAGQIDVTLTVPKTKLEPYARERADELHRLPLAETRYLAFNVQRAPLDDPRIRRALGLAIDRPRLIAAVLHGRQQSAAGFVPPPLRESDAVAAHADVTADARHARALLAAAGFPGGRGFPRLELSAWSPSQVAVLEALQAMWRTELGIEVSLVVREARVHLTALAQGAFDIAFVTTIIDVADAAAVLADFTASAPNNFPAWRSVPYDELLAAAARQPAPETRWSQLVHAESLLLEAAPVVPLYFNVQSWLMSPRVHGWQQDALWNRNYAALSLDEP